MIYRQVETAQPNAAMNIFTLEWALNANPKAQKGDLLPYCGNSTFH